MHESIGYTATLNIFIVFFVVLFAFIIMSMSYFKANKVSNVVTSAIEKYEGYNSLSEKEIIFKLEALGYAMVDIKCPETNGKCTLVNGTSSKVIVEGVQHSKGDKGYCVYLCETESNSTSMSETKNSIASTAGTMAETTVGEVAGTTVNGNNDDYKYYYFRIKTNMLMNIPLINKVLNVSIYSNTNRLYDFSK